MIQFPKKSGYYLLKNAGGHVFQKFSDRRRSAQITALARLRLHPAGRNAFSAEQAVPKAQKDTQDDPIRLLVEIPARQRADRTGTI